MKSCHRTRAALFSAAAVSVLAVAGAANAADQPAAPTTSGPTTITEVVVTARQRSEELQKVPASVTAFTSATIEAKGIDHPRDFIQSTPNVTMIETQNVGTSFVVIRGIDQARNSEPSVSVVVDGVPQTQPAQFNQELLDIQQIEVVKGPQGALYGRNAIGGAILVTTKAPSDIWEGRVTAGYESGPGGKGQAMISGPLSSTLGVRADVSYVNSSGHIENTFLHQKADPISDLSGRLRLVWKPTDKFKADLRLSADRLWTQAFYYNIVYYPGLDFNPGPPYPDYTKFQTPDVNNTSLPVQVNNPGKDNRALYDVSLKLDYDAGFATLSSISGYNLTKEILTGDSFDFLPANQSLLHLFAGFDQNQSQFLRVRTLTQEVRLTSPSDQKFRWIAGAQLFATHRYIANGNEWDTGNGVAPMFYAPTTPVPTFPIGSTNPNPTATWLADGQNNLAWAAYLDTSTNITDQLELSANVRYDSDHRENTTLTPPSYLALVNVPGFPQGVTGQVRTHTWYDWQPQFILKYQATTDMSLYASYGRGFRSGGFNQTGVGAVGFANHFLGLGDLFKAEKSETYEAGFKSRWFDHHLTLNASGYLTNADNAYFFVYLQQTGTQNLGNIPRVRYIGFDVDAAAHLTRDLEVDFGYGYTDASVRQYYPITQIGAYTANYTFRVGESPPNVSKYTLDVALQYRPRLTDKLDGLFRLDYNRIGPTVFWESDPNVQNVGAAPTTTRRPVDLVNLRVGVQSHDWSVVFWSKNLNNHQYNVEYSPGGFVFKAEPRSWGVDLTKNF